MELNRKNSEMCWWVLKVSLDYTITVVTEASFLQYSLHCADQIQKCWNLCTKVINNVWLHLFADTSNLSIGNLSDDANFKQGGNISDKSQVTVPNLVADDVADDPVSTLFKRASFSLKSNSRRIPDMFNETIPAWRVMSSLVSVILYYTQYTQCVPTYSEMTAIRFNGGTDRPTDVVQLHLCPLLSCCCCTHLEQSSAICNCVSISTDFSEEIENRTVSQIVHDCQSSVTQHFVTWPWSFFYYVTTTEIRSLTNYRVTYHHLHHHFIIFVLVLC